MREPNASSNKTTKRKVGGKENNSFAFETDVAFPRGPMVTEG